MNEPRPARAPDGDALSRALREVDPAACLVEARIVRRVLRKHRGVRQGGMQVPHGRCYWVDRASFHALTTDKERGHVADLPERVILVARPEDERRTTSDVHLRELWRSLFHARVHLALEERRSAGTLDEAAVRARVHTLGQTTFDEVRAVLRQDEHLLPGADDVETWIEFAATYLELSIFEPSAVDDTFPTLDRAIAERTLRQDVDGHELLERCRPSAAPAIVPPSAAPSTRPPPRASRVGRPSRTGDVAQLEAARARGNVVRAALDGDEATVLADMTALAHRMLDAVGDHDAHRAEDLGRALLPVALEARAAAIPSFSIEARLLFDLQHACLDHERDARKIDVLDAVFSLFRRPAVRPIPSARPVRVVHQMRRALAKIARTTLAHEVRARVRAALEETVDRADAHLRATLRPRIAQVLDEVGLRPRNVPETVAREKLCDELLDRISAHGHLSIGDLRDALSRNRLKCEDLDARRFFGRDELLRADRALSEQLDGVYRRGEIYLRGLQKLSSLGFGTAIGRFVVMWLILPVVASFVVLEGVSHLVHPIAKRLGHEHVHLLGPVSLPVLSLVIFALLHSATARKIGLAIARGIGFVLHGLFVGAPVWLVTRPIVIAIAQSAPMRAFVRWIVKPAVVAAPAYLVARHYHLSRGVSGLVALAALPVASLILNSAAYAVVEEIAFDGLARVLRNLRKRILPGIVGFLLDAVRWFVDAVERALYWVDERLLFKQGESKLSLVLKGAFGVVWGAISFVVRFYVNLLIEPQVNPIKHFPVVTVSHKIILPMLPTLMGVLAAPLMPLGATLANTIATTTCLLLPGVFGFLAWELKENRRLYRAALPEQLEPVRLGGHGETMTGLLVPGFHSGTIPKLWTRSRRTARRIARREPFFRLAVRSHTRSLTDVHHVEEAVAQFVERELVSLLEKSPRWTGGGLHVGHVRIGSNRVTVSIHTGERLHSRVSHDPTAHVERPCTLAFEEQSGWILAHVAEAGFVSKLSDAQRAVFNDALAGLYRLASVDFVREEIEAAIEDAPYDVCDEGLVVWPGGDFRRELLFDLESKGVCAPVARGGASGKPIDVAALRFDLARLDWVRWAKTWSEADAQPMVTRRLLPSAS